MKKIFLSIIVLSISFQSMAEDIDSVLADLLNHLNAHTSVENDITKLKALDYNFNYPLFLDIRNDHMGKYDPKGFVLLNYLFMYLWNNKDHSSDLIEQIKLVATYTSKANLDNFTSYRGWGTFNALQAASFSCDVDLLKVIHSKVTDTWSSSIPKYEKNYSALSAAYSGGCLNTFEYILDQSITPYDDKCDFLKPPFNFKSQESAEIKQLLQDKYNISDYYSCAKKLKYKGNLSEVTELESIVLEDLPKSLENISTDDFLNGIELLVNNYGYSFPWNALVDGDTIANRILRKIQIDRSDLKLLRALELILRYNDTPYPQLKNTTETYDTFSLLAESCIFHSRYFKISGHPDYTKLRYRSGNKEKTLLHIYVENNCSGINDFETNLVNVFDAGCSIFKAENYSSDSDAGRYFLNKYGFDDFNSCYSSLSTGYEFTIKSGISSNKDPEKIKKKRKHKFRLF